VFELFARRGRRRTDAAHDEGTFCIHAFKTLEIMPTGTVKPCCAFTQHIQQDSRDMTVYEFPLEDIWNSGVMQDVRRAMIAGQPVSDCKYCYSQERQGLTSVRMHANKVFQEGYLNEAGATINDVKNAAADRHFILPRGPEYVEMAVGNLCNIKCRMCYTGYSTAIAADAVHSRWSSSPSMARWDGLTAAIAPNRVVGAAYLGLTDPASASGDRTSWTDGDATIRLEHLTESVAGVSIALSAERPHLHPLKITANGEVLFDGELPDGEWRSSFMFAEALQSGALEIRFQSPTFARQSGRQPVGVGIDELKLVRSQKSRNNVVVSRFKDGRQWHQEPEFLIHEVLRHPDHVKRLYVIGGEPLLSQELRQALRHLTRDGKSRNIVLAFTTNATILDDEWLALARQFKSVSVGVSIDGAGAVNDYIRYPSRWETVVRNLRRYKAEETFDVEVNTTVQAYNVMYAGELIEFCDEERVPFTFLFLDNPQHLDVFAMPENLRLEAARRLRKHLASMTQAHAGSSSVAQARRLAYALEEPAGKTFAAGPVNDFMLFTNDLDASRGQSIHKTLPELVASLAAAGFPWCSDVKFHKAGGRSA
jgi:glutamate-1-semialdehyde 2,1-aminomutase